MVFNDIRNDPDVCSNCFKRTHDRHERNYRLETYYDHEESEWSVRPINVQGIELTISGEKEEIGGFEDEVTRRPKSTDSIPERGGYRGLRTICDCGYRYVPSDKLDEGETWKNRPLKKREFFEYAENLERRLVEAGVTYDEDEYYEILDELKSDPEEQFDDDSIFKRAVQDAVAIANASAAIGSSDD